MILWFISSIDSNLENPGEAIFGSRDCRVPQFHKISAG